MNRQLPYKAIGPGIKEFESIEPLVGGSRLHIEDYRQTSHLVSARNAKNLVIHSSENGKYLCMTELGTEIVLSPTDELTDGKGVRVPLEEGSTYSFALIARESSTSLIVVPYDRIIRPSTALRLEN